MPTIREEITVFGKDAVAKAMEAGFESNGFPMSIHIGYAKFDFVDSKNDPRYETVKSWIASSGVRHTTYSSSKYSENELRQSDWVCVQIRVESVIESDASKRGVVSEGCPICGALNQYDGPVSPVEPPRQNQLVTCTNAGEWLIRKSVCKQFSDMLGPVCGKEWREWGEIQLESVPFKLHNSSKDLILKNPCAECDREGYFVECLKLLRLVYAESPFEINKTGFWGSYELIGNSLFDEYNTSRACPLLYVSGEIAATLQQQSGIDFCVVEFLSKS